MRSTLLLLLMLVTFAMTAHAQAIIVIRLTTHQTCEFNDEDVPCVDVGARMLAKHVPLDVDIRVSASSDVTYEQVSKALISLRDAGYRLKLGY